MIPKLLFVALVALCYSLASAQQGKSDIMLVACDHLAQIYKKDIPATDVLTPAVQKSVQEFSTAVAKYRPDIVMVEVLPEYQAEMDSLYRLYVAGTLNLESLPDGRSEVYQVAFRIAKQMGLPGVACVNAPGGTSQNILDNGENIQLYQATYNSVRQVAGSKGSDLQTGKISLKDYLVFINQPSTYNLVYKLRYITPARVTNGHFTKPDAMIDTAFINPKYIGAELTSVFKNRDYKIYSNIVTTQLRTKAKRMLLIIGGAHIGSLTSIFRDDEEYSLIQATKYLK